MSAKILLIDPLATNRITFGFKLRKAHYRVTSVSCLDELHAEYGNLHWDLIILGAQDHIEIDRIKCDTMLQRLPIIAIYDTDIDFDRLALLKAGADDVMAKPVGEKTLLAKLRSLLRMTHSTKELELREDTNRVLGFNEAPSGFARRQKCVVISDTPRDQNPLESKLAAIKAMSFDWLTPEEFHDLGEALMKRDCFVLALSQATARQSINLILEMRANRETRHSAILVAAPSDSHQSTMDALDLGANDVLLDGYSSEEIEHRIHTQIRHKETNERLRQTVKAGLDAALSDPLTGLFNRRYAMTHLVHCVENARSKQADLAVILVDLDHFKIINDTYGHNTGDIVLTTVANRLKNAIRASDMIARIGGEEFMILLVDPPPSVAKTLADRLCRVISDTDLPDIHHPVTASLGLRSLVIDQEQDTPSNLLNDADRALYHAKANGRNQVIGYSSSLFSQHVSDNSDRQAQPNHLP